MGDGDNGAMVLDPQKHAMRGGTIADIASYDPVFALALAMQIPQVPYSWTLTGVLNDTTDLNTPFEALQQEPLAQRTWVRDIAWSINLPNFFNQQVLSTLATAMYRASTGVQAQVWAWDAPKYIIAPYSPLETLFPNLVARWAHGWRLERLTALKADLLLTQAPAGATSNVGPLTVNITFNGFQFFDPYIDEVPPGEARCVLEKAGFPVGPSVYSCIQGVRSSVGMMGLGKLPTFDYSMGTPDQIRKMIPLGGKRGRE
jgi:hypothetical protein